MMASSLRTRVILPLGCALALAACGSSSSHSTHHAASASAKSSAPAASTARAGHVTVAITNYAFHPATLTVRAGTKITFTNHDQTAHTATAKGGGAFDTGTIQPGKSKTITVAKPGTYPYYCEFHAFMTGTIDVVK